MKAHILVGKTIVGLYKADDGHALRFDLEDGTSITARTDGDCCSYTWVENIENPEAAIGSPVLVAEDIEMPDREYDRDAHDVLAFYGFKIRTAKGDCIIDYRNDSNGYYGGNLVWLDDEYFYGGVYGQNKSNNQFERIA